MDVDKKVKTKTNFDYMPVKLPKATAGRPYVAYLGVNNLPSDPSVNKELERIGLHHYTDRNRIGGTPKEPGAYDFHFNYRKYNESGMEELSTQTLTLIVEKEYDIEVDHDPVHHKYWKESVDTRIVDVNQDDKKRLKKNMAAASRRGQQQITNVKIREDDFCIRYDEKTRWYALAVADGAGKSIYSCKGSQIASNSAVGRCLDRLSKQSGKLRKLTVRYTWRKSNHLLKEIMKMLHEIIASSVNDAYKDIEDEAYAQECLPEDYATTLLMCICKKFEFGWLIGTFGAGDGVICVYHKDNWYANLMGGNEPAAGKSFLTTPGIIQSSEMERRIRFTIVDDFSALFLMTNGVSDPKFECETQLHCFELWNKFWDDINAQVNLSGKINDVGEELLKWLDFWTPGKNDDRTIAMVF